MAKRKTKRSVKKISKPTSSDISDKAVIYVLVAVILVALLSLALYMYYAGQAEPEIIAGSMGEVSLEIIEAPIDQIEDSDGNGEVSLEIIEPVIEEVAEEVVVEEVEEEAITE